MANDNERPKLSAQISAMLREAAKDIRNTVHESYFGRPETVGELGAPGNPTPQMTTEQLRAGQDYQARLEQAARAATQQEQTQERDR